MKIKTSFLPLSALALTLLSAGVTLAQTFTAADVIGKLDAAQKTARDLSFRLSGTGSFDGSAQKIDLSVQSIPASSVARVVFAAPDALADNIVVVDKTEVRNYLYLTNQITVTSAAKVAGQAGAVGLDFSQISNFSAAQSTIRDADVASEAANLTKAQVLQQTSLAALAQANSAPQAILSLLKG